MVTRFTGFLRTFVFIAALGVGPLADAYNNSNTLPNTVYYLMLGGVFTSVVVPLLVRAAKRDADHGEAYAQRIFTLGVFSLFSVTFVATLAAGPLVACTPPCTTPPSITSWCCGPTASSRRSSSTAWTPSSARS